MASGLRPDNKSSKGLNDPLPAKIILESFERKRKRNGYELEILRGAWFNRILLHYNTKISAEKFQMKRSIRGGKPLAWSY